MKFKLFSVVVGTESCIASCPFCVSGVHPNSENLKETSINWRNFDIACKLADRSNIDTVMLTSRGEPLLFPNQITKYLQHLQKYNFPFIELQSNFILVDKNKEKYIKYLKEWYELGLTTMCISVVSNKYEKNRLNYTPKGDYMDLDSVIRLLHGIGFSVRLTCILCNGITSTVDEIHELIKYSKELNIEQLTLRPLNEEFRRESAVKWIKKHMLSDEDKDVIRRFLNENGTLLLELERIGSVYDVDGQNVMFSSPLNMNTRDTDPNNGRQLIFFQDGHLRYEWEKEGGILL